MHRHHPTTRSSRLSRLTVGLLCLGVTVLPLSGCLEDDKLGEAIEQVSGKLEALAAPGTAVPGDQLRTSTYEEAIRTLRPLLTEGSAAQQAAAHLLIARSEFGLASEPAANVVALHGEASSMLGEIRAKQGSLIRLEALAQAAASFEPSTELAELRGRIDERTAGIAAEQTRLAEVQSRVDALDQQAAQADEQANQLRVQESGIRDEAMSMPAPDALPLFKQAAELREQADTLGANAERLRAQADVIRPEINEINEEIARLTEQRRLFEESIENLMAEQERTQRESQSLISQAGEVRNSITSIAGELEGLVSTQIIKAYDDAMSSFEAAGSSARRAASGNRTPARLLSAEVNQTRGGLAAAQADMLGTVAATLRAAELTQAADRIAALADETANTARQALSDARSDYESAGVRGDSADRIDAVIARLNETLGTEEPEAPIEESSEDISPDISPDASPEPESTDEG